MLKASDIQEAGLYWYRDVIGEEPAPVLVCGADLARSDWEVSWFGRPDNDRLDDLPGAFFGPVSAPELPFAAPPGSRRTSPPAHEKSPLKSMP